MSYNYDVNISEQTLNRKLSRGLGDITKISHSKIDELKQKKKRQIHLYKITNFKKEVIGIFTKEKCCEYLNLSWSGVQMSQKKGIRVAGYYYVERVQCAK